MLFWILLAVVVVSALISKRLCAGASSARVLGSLFWALILSVGISAWFFLKKYDSFGHASLWQLTALVFHYFCLLLPILFLGFYWAFMRVHWRQKAHTSMPAFLVSAVMLSLTLGLLASSIYALKIEPNLIEVTHTDIRTPYMKMGVPPLKIVQLSDLHIDEFGYRERKTLQIVERLKPDIIVLTGDYTNHSEKYPDVQRFMKGLHAKYGIYAVHGNWNPMPAAEKFFEGTVVHVLQDRSAVIQTESGRVVIAGIFWYSIREAGRALAGVNTRDSYVILLSHMPDAALHMSISVDLVLSGHTHGGQVRLPFIGPLITFSQVGRARSAGLSKLENGGYLYVNRGLGMEGGGAPRIRFLCRPEISVITIHPKK